VKRKEQLIGAYRKVKMNDINGFNKVIEDLEVYLNKNGSDTQLEFVLNMARVRKADYLGKSLGNIFEIAKPLIETLLTMGDEFFEIEAIATMLYSAESYELSKKLMQKALNALNTKLSGHEKCEFTKLLVFINMSYRLLYSRFYDKVDPKEIKKLFDHCIKSGVTICEKRGANSLVLRTILLIRQAVFYEDFGRIAETLTALKELKDENAFKGIQDEIAEFYHRMDTAPPTDIIGIIVGHQIMRRREELGLTREELSERVGTTPEYIGIIERGVRGLSMTRFMTYAKILNVDYNYMLGNLSKHSKNPFADPEIIQVGEAMSTMSERNKSHVCEHIKLFAKHSQK